MYFEGVRLLHESVQEEMVKFLRVDIIFSYKERLYVVNMLHRREWKVGDSQVVVFGNFSRNVDVK